MVKLNFSEALKPCFYLFLSRLAFQTVDGLKRMNFTETGHDGVPEYIVTAVFTAIALMYEIASDYYVIYDDL